MIKVLVVANDCRWKSWPDKVAELKKWFGGTVELQFDLVHTEYKNIPWTRHQGTDANQQGEGWFGVDPRWYDENITPLGVTHDIILFVLNDDDWKNPNKARGWRTDSDQGPVQLQIGCDERQKMTWPNFERMSAFYQLARHEILHALYMLSGQPDMTHYWWDRGKIENALNGLVIPSKSRVDALTRASAYITSLLNAARLAANTMSNAEKLYKVGYDALGTRMVEAGVPPELGCASSLNNVYERAFGREIGGGASTYLLWEALNASPKFKEVTTPQKGDIILSPTGYPGSKLKNGHVGIVGNVTIMSNNSQTGLWDYHWKLKEWLDYYTVKGGIKTFYYRPL